MIASRYGTSRLYVPWLGSFACNAATWRLCMARITAFSAAAVQKTIRHTHASASAAIFR
jgi:hypothetical protein